MMSGCAAWDWDMASAMFHNLRECLTINYRINVPYLPWFPPVETPSHPEKAKRQKINRFQSWVRVNDYWLEVSSTLPLFPSSFIHSTQSSHLPWTHRHTSLDETVQNHVNEISDLAKGTPDFGLNRWVHFHFLDSESNEFVKNHGHFLSPRIIRMFTKFD